MSKRYSVYVVELSKSVFTKHRRFQDANPQFNGVLECLYVGMTSKSPEDRLKQHKGDLLSRKGKDIGSRLVKDFGLYLRPSLYRHLNPLTKQEAIVMEIQLTKELRRKRYAVWSN